MSSYGNISQTTDNTLSKINKDAREFFSSNSLLAKFAFMILVFIIFVILLRVFTSLLSLIFSPSRSPYLITGMIDAKQMLIIPGDPSAKGAVPISRSINQMDGMEFSWSIWIFIDDYTYKRAEYKHIFHKGNDNINQTTQPTGLNYPQNGPGLYLTPIKNNMVVIMNTFDTIDSEVLVEDIPINKWVNVVIRLDVNHQLDIFINGTLSKRHILAGVPFQNYGDVYMSMNGGFSGYSSCLRYFDYALGTNQINNIVNSGPCLKMQGQDLTAVPHYLSTRWYFAGGAQDEYNPGKQYSSININ